MLPMIMTDSGMLISSGYLDFHDVYRDMVDTTLARPAEADVQATWWRSGDKIEIIVQLKNLRAAALDQANVVAIVYEENRIKVTNRFGRVEVVRNVTDLLPNQDRMVSLTSDALTGVAWDKLRVIVLLEYYRPDLGHYDMLQAAMAQQVAPGLSAAPDSLDFMIDPDDPAAPAVTVQVLGAGFTEWTATADSPWIIVSPASGLLLTHPQVTVDKAALAPGWQTGGITFSSIDAAYADRVTVQAFLGPLERLYIPLTVR